MSDINFSNENYIKEMEKNARLFEEKMNKFEQMRSNKYDDIENQQNTFNKKFKTYNYKKYNSNEINDNKNINEKTSSNDFQKNLINNEQYQDNNIEIYDEKREKQNSEKVYRNQKSFDKNEIIKYKNKIEQLKNEILDKNQIIKQLEKSLKEKEDYPSPKQYEEINNDYEKLKTEMNEKVKYIKRIEVENKELKMKIDNLVEQIKNMKEVIKRKNDEIENMKMDIESLKEEISLNMKKMNNLEMTNKKLNNEYESLNKDFSLLKSEKEKMKQEIEEQNAKIFNYQKELSKNINNKYRNLQNNYAYGRYSLTDKRYIYDKNEEFQKANLDEVKRDDEDYNEEIAPKINKYQNQYFDEDKKKLDNSEYSNNNQAHNLLKNKVGIKKKDYSNYDFENFKSNKNITKPLNSLPDLESRLSYLISEKKKLENEILKMPEHPRNLNEIKIKKELNNKISETEREINSIKSRIRNFNY